MAGNQKFFKITASMIFTVVTVFIASLLPLLATADGAPPPSSGMRQDVAECTTITVPGYYILVNNIVSNRSDTCINITSSDVVFDGNGYTITYDKLLYPYYYMEHAVKAYSPGNMLSNITIINLRAVNWSSGVYFRDVSNSKVSLSSFSNNLYSLRIENSRKINITFNNGTDGGNVWLYGSSSVSILYNVFQNSSIYVDGGGDNNISLNRAYGVHLTNSNQNLVYGNDMSFGGSVHLTNSTHNTVLQNNVSNSSGAGIELYESSYNQISYNIANNNLGDGISLRLSDHNTITDNQMNGNRDSGIYLEGSMWNTISGNLISNNSNGTYIYWYSSNNKISNNTIASNSNFGIYLMWESNNNTLFRNNASMNSFGIRIYYSSNNTVSNNTANKNSHSGIYIKYRSNWNTISSNQANYNQIYGISLYDSCSNNTISGNDASSNEVYGIYILYSDDNTVTENEANYNLKHGIFTDYYSSWNTISNNTASYNKLYGIAITNWSIGNKIRGNTINNSIITNRDAYGIYVYSAPFNEISGNYLKENHKAGIFVRLSDETVITYNTVNNSLGSYNIKLESSDSCIVSDNTATGAYSSIIYLQDSTDARIANNTVSHSSAGSGIQLMNSNGSAVINNTVENNRIGGITLDHGSNNNYLSENKVKDNGGNGIYISESLNNFVTKNKLQKNTNGIFLQNVNSTNLIDNVASENRVSGLVLRDSSNNNLENNLAVGNSYHGIHIYGGSKNNVLTNNNASFNGKAGIYLKSYLSILKFNTASNNKNGIELNTSSHIDVLNNTANNNSEHGIYLYRSNTNNIHNNTASFNRENGIHLYSSYENFLVRNNASYNSDNGIFLKNSDGTIKYNYASNNGDRNVGSGIYLDSSTAGIEENRVDFNIIGIRLEDSSNNTLNDNVLIDNELTGVWIHENSHNNTVSGNRIQSTQFNGVAISSSNRNRLVGNVIEDNGDTGIEIQDSDRNSIIDNIVVMNSIGIQLNKSDNNLIYNNYFSNTLNAVDNGNNRWNISRIPGVSIIFGPYLGGNYWNDYSGVDVNGDWLGDTFLPYNSYGNIINGGDLHPLITPATAYDPFPPVLTFVPPTPVNNTFTNRNYVEINITSNEPLQTALLNWDGVNETMTDRSVSWTDDNWNITKTNLNDRVYIYRVYGQDIVGNWNVTEIRVLIVDTAPPAVTISSPENRTYSNQIIALNVTADEYITAWWYRLDNGTNISFTPNTTLLVTVYGYHRITVYGQDQAGNVGFSSVTFEVLSGGNVTETVPDSVDDSLEQLVSKYYSAFDWTAQTPTKQDVLNAVINAVFHYFSVSDSTAKQSILNDVVQLVGFYFTLPD